MQTEPKPFLCHADKEPELGFLILTDFMMRESSMATKSTFRRFLSDSRGNVAIMGSFLVFGAIAFSGAAVDYSSSANLRSDYQNLADAAVLTAAKTRPKREAAMATVASNAVTSQDMTGTSPQVTTTLTSDGKTLRVQLDGQHSNSFMQIFGKSQTKVSAYAETLVEITESAEIVLVLDTTRSMNYDGRLDSLKRAARTFVDTIDSVGTDDKVRISVVPFGQYVNVGTSQRGQSWLDVPADWTETFPQQCRMERGAVTGQTCTNGTTQPRPGRPAQPGRPATYGTCTDDGVSYRCQTSPAQPPRAAVPAQPGGQPTQSCTNSYGPDVRRCSTPAPIRHVWHGCVGSRSNTSNIDPDYTPGEPQVPGFLDLRCGAEILPPTSNLGAVRRKIDSLTTNGETYTAGGLIWGQRLVNPGAPFPMPTTGANGLPPRRIVVFMTDGFNTRSRTGQRHDGTNRGAADGVSEDICEQMGRDPDLEVYSVAFRVTDRAAKRLIRSCATENDMYYDASDNARLNDAFEDIAHSLLSPRLTG